MRPLGSPPNRRAVQAQIRGLRPATIALAERTTMLAEGALARCPVPGCGRLPAARAGGGLSQIYCRRCTQRASRHGCHHKTTYPASTLNPYRQAAQRFIRANRSDVWVAHALQALRSLMDTAGPVHRVIDTYDMAPADKARAALARMRRREVPPEKLLANFLSVCCALEEDPIRAGSETQTYRRVQAAKACARMAAANDGYYTDRLKKERYARSTGLFLVRLGRMLEECCEHVAAYHLPAILKLTREGRG